MKLITLKRPGDWDYSPMYEHAESRGEVIEFGRSSGRAKGVSGGVDGHSDDGQVQLSCTAVGTVSRGFADIDRTGKSADLAAGVNSAPKCQEPNAQLAGGSQNRTSENQASPADSLTLSSDEPDIDLCHKCDRPMSMCICKHKNENGTFNNGPQASRRVIAFCWSLAGLLFAGLIAFAYLKGKF